MCDRSLAKENCADCLWEGKTQGSIVVSNLLLVSKVCSLKAFVNLFREEVHCPEHE